MPNLLKLKTGIALLAAGVSAPGVAQNTTTDVPPVIDVHFHAMIDTPPRAIPMCPNHSGFLAADPAEANPAPIGWTQEECTPKLYASEPGQYVSDLAAEMERLNVTAVAFGDVATVKRFSDLIPGRIIPGTGFSTAPDADQAEQLAMLEDAFTNQGFKVMGEIGLQYQGMSPSDPSVDAYFALAERLDIPVAIHMGTGGSGRANIYMPNFRASMGDPFLLEDLLARHPKLRVQIMHAGYPMIDNLLALLQANAYVYVDIAGLIWSYPIEEVNRYIERIVDAGFGDRVMFGTDQFMYPKLMAYSISIVQNADYLSSAQKRDILYNNAARFLRLEGDGE